jgi:hypothetical protein
MKILPLYLDLIYIRKSIKTCRKVKYFERKDYTRNIHDYVTVQKRKYWEYRETIAKKTKGIWQQKPFFF